MKFFAPVVFELLDARDLRQVDHLDVLIALDLVRLCFEARNTRGGVALVEIATLAREYEVSEETVRRRLHRLHGLGGIDFETARGTNPTWKIWLTGLSIEDDAPPLSKLAPQVHRSKLWSYSSTRDPNPNGANPDSESDPASHLLHNSPSDRTDKRNEPRPQSKSKAKALDEEKLDKALGETTETDRFLEAIDRSKKRRGS